MKPKSVSLIIATYNWKQALDLVLSSVIKQSLLPNEVIIADDGSTEDTKNLIEQYKAQYPIPLVHSWQEDSGFRLARSRNLAISQVKSEYIIMIDGDMLLHKHFVRDHVNCAQKGYFTQGRRVLIENQLTQKLINKEVQAISIFSSQIKNKLNALSIPLLAPIFTRLLSKKDHRSVRGCNMAYWTQDIIHINGYNESFIGWGREDSEFVVRLLKSGIKRQDLRFGGVAYHLHHKENSKHNLNDNDHLLNETINNYSYYCEHGIIVHLKVNSKGNNKN